MTNPLKEWRIAAEMNVKQASASAGVTPGMWSRWENGVREIPIERAVDLEKKIGVSRADLRPDIFGAATP